MDRAVKTGQTTYTNYYLNQSMRKQHHMEKARKCHVCGQQGKWSKCKICKEQYNKNTYYCSKECQRADLHHHTETDHTHEALAPWGGEERRVIGVNGSAAVGQLKDGQPHGKCRVSGPSGICEGYFKNGVMYKSTNTTQKDGTKYYGYLNPARQQHGRGGQVTPSVSYYGDWYDHQENGTGRITFGDGHQTYVGGMKDGRRHGHGKNTSHAGEIREGEFENDVLVRGTITTGNTIFEGTFRDGKLHGRGVKRFTDKGGGKVQEGFFNNGKFTGTKDETGGAGDGEEAGGAAGGGPGGAAGGKKGNKGMKTHADLLADSVCMLHARICALERKWEI